MLFLEHGFHDELSRAEVAYIATRPCKFSLLLSDRFPLSFSDLILSRMVDLAAENPRLRQTFLAVGFCAEITVVHLLVRIFTE